MRLTNQGGPQRSAAGFTYCATCSGRLSHGHDVTWQCSTAALHPACMPAFTRIGGVAISNATRCRVPVVLLVFHTPLWRCQWRGDNAPRHALGARRSTGQAHLLVAHLAALSRHRHMQDGGTAVFPTPLKRCATKRLVFLVVPTCAKRIVLALLHTHPLWNLSLFH
jgi:hypothetical protein